MWRSTGAVTVIGALLAAGCASQHDAAPAARVEDAGARADDLLVVDCLLPPRLIRLGRSATYMSNPQPIKASARTCEIRGGKYVAYDRANYATSLKVWLPSAEAGDPAAQTYVGEIFEKGLGVSPDYAAAAVWYRRAAEQGYARAAISLGNLFEQGLGVPKSPTDALNWYRRAAGLGPLPVSYEIVPGKATAELGQLREQIADLRRQLQAKQTELDATRSEVEKLRRTLEERRGEADAERASLARLRGELEDARRTGQTAAARITEFQRSIADAEARLNAKDREVAALRTSLERSEKAGAQRAALDREVANLRSALARAEAELNAERAGLRRVAEQTAPAGPRIELVQVQLLDPENAPTRGAPGPRAAAAPAPAAMKVLLVGRVTSAAGLKSLTVDGRQAMPDAQTLFRSEIPLGEPDRRVRITAVDRNDRTSTLEFLLPTIDVRPARHTERPPERQTPRAASPAIDLGHYHALVIGNNEYQYRPRLRTAVGDAQEVAKVLKEQYRFQVTLLTNATRYQTLSALSMLLEKLTSKDNLLIYYAGHGVLDEKNRRGIWLPVDAEPNNTANWIPISDVTAILNAMTVKQLLVVADSCYAGMLTRSVNGQLEPGITEEELVEVVQKMAQQRSRMALTSGGLEPVVDSTGGEHSAFAEMFVQVLRGNDGLLLGREVFRRVQLRVAVLADRLAVQQVPEYAPIQFAGHEGGDFVFARR